MDGADNKGPSTFHVDLQKSPSSAAIYIPESDLHIDVSAVIGVLSIQGDMDDQEKLSSLADKVRYQAAETARNRNSFHHQIKTDAKSSMMR